MRELARPPRLDDQSLIRAMSSAGRPEVQAYVTEANRDYLHWDKLRFHPRPEGLSQAEAWALVRMARLSQRKPLELLDGQRRPFGYGLPPGSLEILHEVDRWGGTTMAVDTALAPALGPLRDRVVVGSLMEEAIATSQIEGAVTTRKVAKEMLRTQRKPRDRSEQMIVNSYQTIQTLRQRLDRPLSVDLLFEIQASITQGTLDDPDAVGRLRRADENIHIVDTRDDEVVYDPPPADRLPERLEKLIRFANQTESGSDFVHPLVKAAILHFWLAYEHPFVDGNGRTARALLYWFMLKSGYWLFEFLTISRVIAESSGQYYRSFVYSEHDDNDLTYSVLYQMRATQRALKNLREYLALKQREQQEASAALRAFPEVNYRQRDLLADALREPARIWTFKEYRSIHQVTLVTARSDLLDLLERGLLREVKGRGTQRAFVAAEQLIDRLRSPVPGSAEAPSAETARPD